MQEDLVASDDVAEAIGSSVTPSCLGARACRGTL